VVAKPSPGGVERGRPHAVVGRDADDVHIGHVAHPQPGGQADAAGLPSKPEYAAACSPFSKTASMRSVSSAGMELDPGGADHAVRRPRSHVVGRVAEVGTGIDVVVLVATTWSHAARPRPRPARAEIPAATMAPPATGSDPPSQKSFCTSTMISARVT
jgi:hypothetical protein